MGQMREARRKTVQPQGASVQPRAHADEALNLNILMIGHHIWRPSECHEFRTGVKRVVQMNEVELAHPQ